MKAPTISKKDIIDAFQYRHATKEFDTRKKLSDADIKFILHIANLSPSSFGCEPWHFVVVQKPELRAALIPVVTGAPLRLKTASHFVLGLSMKAPMTRWDSNYIMQLMKEVKQFPEANIKRYLGLIREFQEHDFVLDTDRKMFDWASKQSYIVLGNMLTAAAMIGIDSCPIEGFIREKAEVLLKEKFGVDTEKYGLSYMVAFGYRKENPKRPKSRRNRTDIISWK
ncbi:NAD(P)H-dependent oxidoreductase [Maribacter sp.]|nr:NAD(P)H-dependent oxidoreductase [Maribacter sp.]